MTRESSVAIGEAAWLDTELFDSRSGTVRRSQIGELRKQIAVGPNRVPGHLPVCEDCQESVAGIVGERPAIARKGRRTRRVVGQHIGQKRERGPLCLLWRISTRVL